MASSLARFDTFRFFLWGYLKQKVYETEPASILDLRQKITNICRNIDVTVFENVRREISDRLFLCQEVQGNHFQHLFN